MLAKEINFFKSHPLPMRVLLLTNLIYALVLPIIELLLVLISCEKVMTSVWLSSFNFHCI